MRTRRPGGYLVAAAAVCAFVQLAAACGGPARPVAHPAPAVSQRRAGPPSSTPAMRSSALPPGAPGSARPRSARLPRTDWAVPGSVIRNLDTAPGSPYRPGEKVVALTFDDGPSAVYTPQILRILVAARASASFEIIGVHGGAYPRPPGPVPAAAVWPKRSGGGHTAAQARPGRARLGRRPVGLPAAGCRGDHPAGAIGPAPRRYRDHARRRR